MHWIGSLTPFASNMWLSSICFRMTAIGISLNYPIRTRLNGMIEWYRSQLKKTVRITLMCGRGGRQVGVKSSSPFSFYPAASCPYHRYWVDIMVVEFVGYYQAQFLWNFQEWCSKSIHFFIDLSINKENLRQPRLDCPCSPTIC